MKLAWTTAALVFLAMPSYAADDPAKPMTDQQSKMAQCNKAATGMKGDDRKAFMKDCLTKHESQQDKMKRCNAEAEGKKGDERKAFMSECLKGSPKA